MRVSTSTRVAIAVASTPRRARRRRRANATRRRARDDDGTTKDDDDDDDDDGLDGLVRRACARIGRGDEEAKEMTARLRANWFETAEDVRGMGPEDARAAGVPARLFASVRATLDEDEEDDVEARNGETKGTKREESESGWIGGALPGAGTRAPTVTREGGTALADVRVTQRRRLKPFSLRGEEVSAELEEELNTLVRDLTSRRVGGGRAPVRERTAMNHVAVAKQFMGWLCRESEHASEFATLSVDGRVVLRPGVSLRDAFPKRESEGAKYAIEYVQWLSDERRIKSTTEDFQLRSLVALAKWVHAFVEDDGIAPPCVQELVRVQRSARDRAKNAPHAADDDRKWLEWDQYLALVEHLKLECAPLDCNGKERSEREIAMSVQRYLLFAILACIPDRQRTLRELQLNKTLFRDASTGAWMVRHGSDDYKTGGAYGERPALVIDSRVYPALESWLSTHRAALSPSHDFVFTRPNGTPWTVSELSRTFSRAALRVTGQKTNPHLIRDMIVTHVRSRGIASDAELEALARFMGHSSAMQKSTYDRRTTQEKVNPALSLMANVNAAAPPSRPASAPS